MEKVFSKIQLYCGGLPPHNNIIIIITSHYCVLHAGNPVAWLISDREDAAIMECFLQAVKSQSPSVPINAAMTDDGIKLYKKVSNYSFTVFN